MPPKIESLIAEMGILLERTEIEYQKFSDRGNKEAIKRIRKNMLLMKKTAHQVRKQAQEERKALK